MWPDAQRWNTSQRCFLPSWQAPDMDVREKMQRRSGGIGQWYPWPCPLVSRASRHGPAHWPGLTAPHADANLDAVFGLTPPSDARWKLAAPNLHPLKQVLRRLVRGENVSMAFLGQSVTHGGSATDLCHEARCRPHAVWFHSKQQQCRPRNGWVCLVIAWFKSRFTGQVSATLLHTPSSLQAACYGDVLRSFPHGRIDLLFHELGVNGEGDLHCLQERVVRLTLLQMQPAAVVMCLLSRNPSVRALSQPHPRSCRRSDLHPRIDMPADNCRTANVSEWEASATTPAPLPAAASPSALCPVIPTRVKGLAAIGDHYRLPVLWTDRLACNPQAGDGNIFERMRDGQARQLQLQLRKELSSQRQLQLRKELSSQRRPVSSYLHWLPLGESLGRYEETGHRWLDNSFQAQG